MVQHPIINFLRFPVSPSQFLVLFPDFIQVFFHLFQGIGQVAIFEAGFIAEFLYGMVDLLLQEVDLFLEYKVGFIQVNVQPVLQVCSMGDSFQLGGQIHAGHFDNGRVKPVGKDGIYLFADVFRIIPELVGLVLLVVDEEKLLQCHDVAVVVIPGVPLDLFFAQQADFLKCLLDVCLFENPVWESFVPDFSYSQIITRPCSLFGKNSS